jgi:hypothetical protein
MNSQLQSVCLELSLGEVVLVNNSINFCCLMLDSDSSFENFFRLTLDKALNFMETLEARGRNYSFLEINFMLQCIEFSLQSKRLMATEPDESDHFPTVIGASREKAYLMLIKLRPQVPQSLVQP